MRGNRTKYIICILLLLAALLFSTGVKDLIPSGAGTELKIGVFADSYWGVHNGYEHRIPDDAIKFFEKDHPGVRISYETGILKEDYTEWLAEQIMKGEAPDVFLVMPEDFDLLIKMQALEDITDYVDKDKDFNKEIFYRSAYRFGSFDDAQYLLPFECAPELMFTNTTILDEKGIETPSLNWTWDDFYDICKRVNSASGSATGEKKEVFGTVNYTWKEAFAANGNRLFSTDGRECDFADTKITTALTFLDELNSLNEGNKDNARYFTKGNVAFQPMYYASYRDFVKNPLRESLYEDFELTFLTMPAGSEGDNTSILDTLCVGMYSKSRHKKEAWEFIKMLTTDETIQSEIFKYSEGLSPCLDITERELKKELEDSAPGSQNINMDVVLHAMDTAVPKYAFYGQDEAESAVEYAVNEILTGEGNIRMEQVIQDRKIKGILSGE
ncbi:MAG: extracellular solute-binding protein [Lachnospiraceae bacterium]|nr:extracellular solute-binding protein [Lachnospiraceae bacterium]